LPAEILIRVLDEFFLFVEADDEVRNDERRRIMAIQFPVIAAVAVYLGKRRVPIAWEKRRALSPYLPAISTEEDDMLTMTVRPLNDL
jgi:hypothetical protein